jgi:hypothetical protein
MHRKRNAENDVPRAGSIRRSGKLSRWNMSLRRRITAACAVVALVSVGTVVGTTGVASAASLPCPTGASCGNGYVPLASPTRIADTRTVANGGSTNPYNGKTLAAGTNLAVTVPTTGAGAVVPATATAVVVNITAVGPTNAGYLEVYPGTTAPATPTANIDFTTGQTVGNEVTIGLSGSDVFTVAYGPAGAGNVDFTADVMGYYEPETTAGATPGYYVPVAPTRLYDSRTASGQPGAGTTLTNGGSDKVTVAGAVTGVSNPVPATATAVVLNVAITNPTAFSFVYAYPTGQTAPFVANQNFTAGETLSAQVIVGVGTGGQVTIANHTGNVDVVVDVDGYYTADGTVAGASLLSTLPAPIRLLDTRNNIPSGTPVGVSGGSSGVAPAPLTTFSSPYNAGLGASAYALSISDIASGGNYLTAYATGTALPVVANVNYSAGNAYNVVENATYAGVNANGEVSVENGPNTAATTNIVVDEDAYFVPQPFTVQVFAVPYPNTTTTPGTTSVSIPATIPANGTSQAEFFVNTQNLGLLGSGGAIDFTVSGTSGCTAAQFSVNGGAPGLPPGATPGYAIVYTSNTTAGTCILNVTVPGETATGSATVTQT